MIATNNSTIFNSNGQFFSRSEYQGAVYQEVTFASPLVWDKQFSLTEPLGEALTNNTISNYPVNNNKYFMGSFDGFWVHKVYSNGRHVMTIQTVDQDMFIPVPHDTVYSVCMATELDGDDIDTEIPDVPAPGVLAVIGIAAIIGVRKRK